MKPAARMGDPTVCGKPLSPSTGSPNVLIGGKPAWRAGSDFHSCPLTTALIPHVGGVVTNGSTSVMINGRPAARMGDSIMETAAVNTIVGGEPTVQIG